MSQVREVFRWLIGNLLLVAGIWYGGVQGIEWVVNVTRFAIWLHLIGAIAVLPGLLFWERLSNKPFTRSVIPKSLSLLAAILLSFGLAAVGWTVTAGAYIAGVIIALLGRAVAEAPFTKKGASHGG